LKTIYFVRHGEFPAQITREFSYKKVDYSLTDRGIRQSQLTAEHLRNKSICSIYSSPLKRATETAKIIGDALNIDVVILEDFREVNVGSLEGKEPTEENWNLYNRIIRDWREGKYESRFPDGENYLELLKRVRKGLHEVLRNVCSDILIVAHGGILLASLADICENFETRNFRKWDNCAITTVEMDEAISGTPRGRVLYWHDCQHLLGI
jgi:broad specificity phosphatase PhoE